MRTRSPQFLTYSRQKGTIVHSEVINVYHRWRFVEVGRSCV